MATKEKMIKPNLYEILGLTPLAKKDLPESTKCTSKLEASIEQID